MLRVSDILINYLSKYGIKHIFTVSGGGSIFLCDALGKNQDIEITTRRLKTTRSATVHDV